MCCRGFPHGEHTIHPPEFVRTRMDRIIVLLTFGSWIVATFHSVFVPLHTGTPANEPLASDIYRFPRHAMYLGSWLCFLGLILTTLSLGAAGALLVMLALYLFVSRHEEKLLLALFGSRYREYQAATPMFFPLRLRALKRAGPSP